MNSPLGAIVGVAESDLGEVAPKTVLQLQAEAAKAALEDAGLTLRDVDAVFTAGSDWSWAPAMLVAEYLGIQPRYTDSTNIGGASFEAHVGHAVTAIRAGLCDVALITYGSTQRSQRSRRLGRSGRFALRSSSSASGGCRYLSERTRWLRSGICTCTERSQSNLPKWQSPHGSGRCSIPKPG